MSAIITPATNMVQLCQSFPLLRGVPGSDPWDQEKFSQWLSGPAPTGGSIECGKFVLSVWAGTSLEQYWTDRHGVFDPLALIARCDDSHREAFIRWCNNPFWP